MANRRAVKEFEHQGKVFRLVSICRREWERGYSEPSQEHYNVLQVRLTNLFSILWNLSFWKDVELEHIPSHAWISLACFGDTGGWTSALHTKCRDTMGMNF